MTQHLPVAPVVSAIVSTYNAERFIRGKLEDLEAQTLAQELEIIVIDSASPQNERAVVEEFQKRYANIRYIRTERRETVYQAWNRGIREARGEFVTNANTDDRLRRDCYETLVRTLRERPECVLAYPDMRITLQENGTFENHVPHGFRDWPAFDRISLLEVCCVGPFPLWRKSLHDEIGYFDERFKSIADYEFWLRAALTHDFVHVPQFLGLYWMSEDTVSRKGDLPALEYLQVQKEYRPRYARLTQPPAAPAPGERARYHSFVTANAVGEIEQFARLHPRWPRVHQDLAGIYHRNGTVGKAREHYEKAALLDPMSAVHRERLQAFLERELAPSLQEYRALAARQPDDLDAHLVLGMIHLVLDRPDLALRHYRRASEIDPDNALTRENIASIDRALRTSIVVLAGSGVGRTRECLESIERNTREPHEIIVVDTGSGDGTLAFLRDFCAATSHRSVIGCGGGAGAAAALNAGVRAATGGRIVFMTDDVVVTADWLPAMAAALEREGDAAIVAPMTTGVAGAQCVSGTGYRSIDELEEFARRFRSANLGRRVEVDRMAAVCILFTRNILERVGEFDSHLAPGDFDDDFCLRASLGGHRCVLAADVFVHHYGSRALGWNRTDYAAVSRDRTVFEEKWDLPRLDPALAAQVVTVNAMEDGRRLARKGRLNDAVELLLQRGIACSPDRPDAYHVLAGVLVESGNFTDALDVLATVPAGENAVSSLLQGRALAGLRRLHEAAEHAKRALRLAPGSAGALLLKGQIAAQLGDSAAAEELFVGALSADPGFGPAFTALSALVWNRGEREQALHLAETGFVLSPLDMTALDRFHSYATALDALPREEARVRQAREIHPDHKGLAFGVIEILIRGGRFQEAIEEIQRAAVDFGLDDAAIDAALEIRRLAGDPPPAQKGSASVSLCMIVKNEAKQLPAALLSVKGLADEVVIVDTGSTDRTCDIARVFGARLFTFAWTGSFSEARNFSFSKASGDWILVMDPDEVFCSRDLPPVAALLRRTASPTAYSFPIRNYVDELARKHWHPNQGEYRDEERGRGWVPGERVRLFPNDSRIQYKGVVHELLEPSVVACGIPIHDCDVPVHHYGKLDAARCAEKQVLYYQLGLKKLAESGGDLQSLSELALQATELHRFDEAEALWHRVLDVDPSSAEAWFNLSYLYLATGAYHKARAHALKATGIAPAMKEAAFNLAKSEFMLGMPEVALARCQQMLQKWPEHPPALSLLCAAALLLGRDLEADAALAKVRRMGFDCCDFLTEYAEGLKKGDRGDLAAPLVACAERVAREAASTARRDCTVSRSRDGGEYYRDAM